MPAKKGKRVTTKAATDVEENEGNLEELEVEDVLAKKKGRGAKPTAVSEQIEAPVKSKSAKNEPENNQNESVSATEDELKSTSTSKRGQASKKIESGDLKKTKGKLKDKGNDVQESQRRGADRAAKKGLSMADESENTEQKPTKGRGRKPAHKDIGGDGDAEPATKKSRGRPKKEDGSEAQPKRKTRPPKGATKNKEADEKEDSEAENGVDEDANIDMADIKGKELRIAVEHCKS